MKLTPLDIHHKEFRNALRGYSPEQVDDFLDEVADEFERLFKENIDLSEKLEAASVRVREYGALEQTLQNTLVSAQTSAEEIKSRATADAARLVSEAEVKAAQIVASSLEEKQHSQAECARLQEAEKAFRSSFRSLLENYLANLADPGSSDEPEPPAQAVQPEPVVEPEPVADLEPVAEPEPIVEEPAAVAETEAEAGESGSVISLTLGEFGGSETVLDDDMPSLEIPEEFALPPRGSAGELDDLDIEEID